MTCTTESHERLKSGGPHSHDWLAQEFRAIWEGLELRNCRACGSTLGIEMTGIPAVLDARLGDLDAAIELLADWTDGLSAQVRGDVRVRLFRVGQRVNELVVK